jgi:hypothetical protein
VHQLTTVAATAPKLRPQDECALHRAWFVCSPVENAPRRVNAGGRILVSQGVPPWLVPRTAATVLGRLWSPYYLTLHYTKLRNAAAHQSVKAARESTGACLDFIDQKRIRIRLVLIRRVRHREKLLLKWQ